METQYINFVVIIYLIQYKNILIIFLLFFQIKFSQQNVYQLSIIKSVIVTVSLNTKYQYFKILLINTFYLYLEESCCYRAIGKAHDNSRTGPPASAKVSVSAKVSANFGRNRNCRRNLIFCRNSAETETETELSVEHYYLGLRQSSSYHYKQLTQH